MLLAQSFGTNAPDGRPLTRREARSHTLGVPPRAARGAGPSYSKVIVAKFESCSVGVIRARASRLLPTSAVWFGIA